jgi:tetratricopeptide (TPR) repeat protein
MMTMAVAAWPVRLGSVAFAAVAAMAAGCSRRDPGERERAHEQVAAERPAGGAAAGAAGGGLEAGTASPEAREHFRRGLAALHSFWYDEASRQFEAAIAADRRFAMAHWGLAMSKSKLLWGDDDLAGGRRALGDMPPSSGLPARERAWIDAARALFAEGNVPTSRRAFAAAMEKVHADHPDDESTAFLAIALVATTRPGDPSAGPVRERAAALAGEVFARNPKHPGAAHYLIHALDTPAEAHRALPAARVYAAIAPEAFHARHMPAHIFSRLGMWKEAVASCQSAWDASVAWAGREHLSPDHHDFHSLSWIVEMSFERGRRSEADAAMKLFADSVKAGLNHHNRIAYAGQVLSYLGRTEEWKRVDELLAPLDAPATDDAAAGGGSGAAVCGQHGPAPAGPPMDLFERRAVLQARTRPAALRRDLAATRRLLAERAAVDRELRPFFAATQPPDYLTRLDQDRAVSEAGMMARARGDDRALLAPLGHIAERGRDEFAAEGTAGGNLAQEEIGDTLFRLGRPGEALAAYQAVLAQHPGRAHSLLGAVRAAAKAGDAAAARGFYEKLLEVWSEAEEGTPGLAEARAQVK